MESEGSRDENPRRCRDFFERLEGRQCLSFVRGTIHFLRIPPVVYRRFIPGRLNHPARPIDRKATFPNGRKLFVVSGNKRRMAEVAALEVM